MTTATAIFGALKIVITLTAAILVIIALAKPAWIVSSFDGATEGEGLFRKCYYQHNTYDGPYDGPYDGYYERDPRLLDNYRRDDEDRNCKKISPVPRRLKVVRAFMIMGCIELLLALILAVLVTAQMPVPASSITILFFCAGIFIMIACAVYTATYRHTLADYSGFGYAYWCAWAAFVITILALPLIAIVQSAYQAIPA